LAHAGASVDARVCRQTGQRGQIFEESLAMDVRACESDDGKEMYYSDMTARLDILFGKGRERG